MTLFRTTAGPWEVGSLMKRVEEEMEDKGLNQWMHHKTSAVKGMRNNSREVDAGSVCECVCVYLEIMKHFNVVREGREGEKKDTEAQESSFLRKWGEGNLHS